MARVDRNQTVPALEFEHGLVFLTLAKLYAHSDRPEEQRIAAEGAARRFEPLVQRTPGNPDYLYCLVDASLELGDAQRSLAQTDRGASDMGKALGLAEDLACSHTANGYFRHFVADIAYSLASLAYHERRQPSEARPLLQKALEIEENLNLAFPNVGEYGFYRGNLHRDFRDWFDDTGPALAWRDRLNKLIAEYEEQAQSHPEKCDRNQLSLCFTCLECVDELLGRHRDIDADTRRSVAHGFDHQTVAWSKVVLLAEQGDYVGADAATAAIATHDTDQGTSFYQAANHATLVKIVGNDHSLPTVKKNELREKFGKQAVDWLGKARDRKYLCSPSTRWLLADDRDLDPIRDRADFRALLTRVSVFFHHGAVVGIAESAARRIFARISAPPIEWAEPVAAPGRGRITRSTRHLRGGADRPGGPDARSVFRPPGHAA